MYSTGAVHWDESAKRRWRTRLLAWYDRNSRDLPWRRDRDPYRVWVSEIMLQQTRVSAVVEHYRRFLQRFPTLSRLASARESSVLAAWSGLGYYRRARMLHAAARIVMREHGGRVPGSLAELRDLPGVGRYTAAAIASIGFNAAEPVVDGNVERVLERAVGRALKPNEIWLTAGDLLDAGRPGDFNQAMMELGATTCLPGKPRCSVCPVSDICVTRGAIPQPPKTLRQKRREIFYALESRERSVFLVQRSRQASLMPGMWELPEIPADSVHNPASLTLRHSITMTDYRVRVVRDGLRLEVPGRWVETSRIKRMPLTGLARKILRRAEII